MKNTPETLAKRNALKKKWKNEIDPSTFPHEIIKECKDCHKMKPCKWLSSFTQTGKPEYRSRCNGCHLIKARGWRKKGRASTSVRVRVRRQKRKVKCIEYKGGKCERCGYDKCHGALTFHHTIKAEKDRDITQMIDHSWERLTAELDKCELLCFNCHMEEHYEHIL